jgi:transcription-repair coupling factor (superfamily II helicase)
MYHAQKLRDDAKKRLRAIIEASELGSGFQIAMRDLEIRGAGEILGAKQHGTLNSIGVAHFCRLLAKAVDDLKLGKTDLKAEDITPDTKIELKISAYLPDEYVPKSIEKIRYYQRLSGVESKEDLDVLKSELEDKYGEIPLESENLMRIISLKLIAKEHGVVAIREIEINGKDSVEMHLGQKVKPKAIMGLLSYNERWKIIESKMTISKEYLGKDWFTEIKDCVLHLK